jgi:hypothetical protein
MPQLRYNECFFSVEWEAMEAILHLGPVFTDHTSAGKMRDCYHIALFRLANVVQLFGNRRCTEAVYLLPWTLLVISFRSDAIAKEARLFLVEVTLALFAKLDIDLVEGGSGLNEQGPAGSSVSPLKRITLIRTISTIIGVIYALIMIDGGIPLDRISTHPLENFFGLLRLILHDCNKFEEFLHAAARNVIVNEIFHELGHPRDICGRENQGGVVSGISGKTTPIQSSRPQRRPRKFGRLFRREPRLIRTCQAERLKKWTRSYPGLKRWNQSCQQSKLSVMVISRFGRRRTRRL